MSGPLAGDTSPSPFNIETDLTADLLDALEEPACLVDRAGVITAVNQAWVLSCLTRGGDLFSAGVGADYLAACGEPGRLVAHGLRHVLAGQRNSFRQDYACHGPDVQAWFSVLIHCLPGRRALIRHFDTTDRVRVLSALERAEQYDPLTGLLNRQVFTSRLDQVLLAAGRGRHTAVVLLGLDRFARVNEALGHAAGDDLLCAVARRLSGVLLPGDVLARCDGDEFAVLRPRLTRGQDAEHIGHDLARSLLEPFVTASTTVTLTASTGVAVGQAPQTAVQLLADADAARNQARLFGGGRTRLSTSQLRNGMAEQLRLEQELRDGLEREQFVLHYQPMVDLVTRQVTGVEALLRWQHPDGLRMPDAFIPCAEQSGAIVALGSWVLHEACRQAAAWSRSGLRLDMAVNFSARQISHPDVITDLTHALTSTGLPPQRLLVEVTESMLMEDSELAADALTAIRALGAGTAIDDFGTGYGSLLYLKLYPVSVVKIDRQFVAGLGSRRDDEAIVASVVSLAHSVGAVCIAEGVETLEQYAALRQMGCEFSQGYLFGRPVPAEELPQAVKDCARLLAEYETAGFPAAAVG